MKYLNKLNSLAVKVVSKKVVINHHVLFCNCRIINLHEFWYNDRYTCCGTYFAKVSCIHGVSVIFWVCMSLFVPKRKLRILRLEFVVGLLLSDVAFLLADAVNKEVKVKEICCCSDKEKILWWIKQYGEVWNVWVQNHVQQIREMIPLSR